MFRQKKEKKSKILIRLTINIVFCSQLFVTLEEFSAFLCLKAAWRIEEKLGYELETVLNSAFCYKLHQRTPDNEPSAVL